MIEMHWDYWKEKLRAKNHKGRPKRMWFDDIRQWAMLKD